MQNFRAQNSNKKTVVDRKRCGMGSDYQNGRFQAGVTMLELPHLQKQMCQELQEFVKKYLMYDPRLLYSALIASLFRVCEYHETSYETIEELFESLWKYYEKENE